MAERTIVLLPKLQKILMTVGENLKLARLRRKLTVVQVAERAGTHVLQQDHRELRC